MPPSSMRASAKRCRSAGISSRSNRRSCSPNTSCSSSPDRLMIQFFYFHLMPWRTCPTTSTAPSLVLGDVFQQVLRPATRLRAVQRVSRRDGARPNPRLRRVWGHEHIECLRHDALAQPHGCSTHPAHAAAKIAILGNAIPLRDHPLRVAEEVAMLDVMSGGRIISGFVRGIGCEYLSSVSTDILARTVLRSARADPCALDRGWSVLVRGKHYQVRYANIWPRRCRSRIRRFGCVTGAARKHSLGRGQRRYPFISVFTSYAQTRRLIDEYRAAAEAAGYAAQPEQIGFALRPTWPRPTRAPARKRNRISCGSFAAA